MEKREILKKRNKTVIFVIFALFLSLFIWGDDRKDPIDMVIAVDKSLSMQEEIEEVKEFIIDFIDKTLQPGDFFMVISFYGNTEVILSVTVESEAHKNEIKNYLSTLKADGYYTDIGTALDMIDLEAENLKDNGRRKSLLLLTDGANNPLPGSKYFSEDKKLSHKLLLKDNTREILKGTWKVIYLSIGEESTIDLSEEMGAQNIQIPDNATASQISEAIPDVRGGIEIDKEGVLVQKIGAEGRSMITIPVKTAGYSENVEIFITSIQFRNDAFTSSNILLNPFKSVLPKEGEAKLEIPLSFANDVNSRVLQPGDYSGDFIFYFSSKEAFNNVKVPVSFHVNSFLENYPWLIILFILPALILVALIIFAVIKIIKGFSLKFRLVVKEHPLRKGADVFKVGKSPSYLVESMDIFKIAPRKSLKSLAQLSYANKKLVLKVLNSERFPSPKKQYDNVLDSVITAYTEMGEEFHIKFEKL